VNGSPAKRPPAPETRLFPHQYPNPATMMMEAVAKLRPHRLQRNLPPLQRPLPHPKRCQKQAAALILAQYSPH